ncbi:MAG: ABC transporter permease [Clostridiales Family XIII bacterium]|jgi:osmoprotectant transport system permease protein|nr:ABC transporter permease [Clostridiales Family XIII bacterium]
MPEALAYIESHREQYVDALLAHLTIDAISLLICVAVAAPLGYLGAKCGRLTLPLQNVTGMIRIIPGIAIFLVLIPITGLGQTPAIIALVIMSVPPLLMSAIAGLRSVAPSVVESAAAMGMGRLQTLIEVELPLALPTLLDGLRITTVSLIAGTTIAAYVGAGGLGTLIVSGLSQNKQGVMLAGALTAAAIAIAADAFIAAMRRRALRKISA